MNKDRPPFHMDDKLIKAAIECAEAFEEEERELRESTCCTCNQPKND